LDLTAGATTALL